MMAALTTRRAVLRAAALVFVLGAAPGRVLAQQAQDAATAMRTGKYPEAIALYTRLAALDSAPVSAQRGLVRALAMVGRYSDAEDAARRAMTSPARTRELSNVLGEVLFTRGQLPEAEAAFSRAVTEHATDSLAALIGLASAQYSRGAREQALGLFDHFIDVYNERSDKLTSDEFASVAVACRYLGVRDPELFKDALKAFEKAIAKDSTNIEVFVEEGFLFLEKYNGTEAKATFDAILAVNPSHPGALLGSARQRDADGEPGADSLLRRSLAVNQNFVPARVFLAELLIGAEDYPGALAEAQRALTVDPGSPLALSVIAAVKYVQGDKAGFEDAAQRALARDPKSADVFSVVAELSARNRLYAQAETLATRALTLDSLSPRALGILGVNRLRAGNVDGARASLERAFKLDPFDVLVKNTLDLLDTFQRYRTATTARFVLVADSAEADLLPLYAGPLAEEAYDAYAKRYNYRPPTPVRLEFFRRHADFSVRTVGLTGLGALGVSFGNVLALDSPSARERGAFNWGSTLWHELAHTFTLGVSDHRVPRWLSEGLSVLEERRDHPGWGADVTPGFLIALKAGKLVPVSRMNDGFMRPAYPEQVIYSYYQASLLCEMIEQEKGTAAILAMLAAYKEGRSTEDVFQRVLGTSVAAYDTKFDAALRARFAGPLAAMRLPDSTTGPPSPEDLERRAQDPRDFIGQIAMGERLVGEKKYAEAIPFLMRAKSLFPEYSGDDGPAALLAVVYNETGEFAKAIAELTELVNKNESALDAHVLLAHLQESQGDKAGAAATLERLMFIWPLDVSTHLHLADLYAQINEKQKAVRERRAVIAMAPVDRAEAFYQLALALFQAGDKAAARSEVLKALDEAPNFEKAQSLLLMIRGGSGRKER